MKRGDRGGYGRAPGIHQENLHLIHAHVPDYNYPLRGTDSGWFVMEIEPGFYQVKPASWRLKGNPGDILYLGTFTRRQEFVEPPGPPVPAPRNGKGPDLAIFRRRQP